MLRFRIRQTTDEQHSVETLGSPVPLSSAGAACDVSVFIPVSSSPQSPLRRVEFNVAADSNSRNGRGKVGVLRAGFYARILAF